jgi:hypothetical protein
MLINKAIPTALFQLGAILLPTHDKHYDGQ